MRNLAFAAYRAGNQQEAIRDSLGKASAVV
jgi:hypothetical protein